MQTVPPAVALLIGALVALALVLAGARASSVLRRRAREEAAREAARVTGEAEARAREIAVSVQEKALAQAEEAERRERELEARETALDARARKVEREAGELARLRRDLERRQAQVGQSEQAAREAEEAASAAREAARRDLERIAGLSAAQAREELIAGIAEEARRQAAQLARRIEDEARENAEREALSLVVHAAQKVDLREVLESTVTFIELPSDEMKGRIIGREGRNIRALEMATGIDLVVDDTPRAILLSCFDPIRREVAKVAIGRLIEDGRIHPARIEEVVARVRQELETQVEEAGSQAAFGLGITDLHPRLCRLVGRMRYRTHHGHNLLAHCTETALIAGSMAQEVGGRAAVARRAALLHEVGRVDEAANGHPALASAELAGRHGESEEVVHAIQALHPEVEPRSLEALLVATANRISDNRPGARKDNLQIFIERLRRLETIAAAQPGVEQAYAVKAGKEIRVLVDAKAVSDDEAYGLARRIARTLEKEVSYPGQIKVSVVRETRAVQFAV